MLQPYLGLFPEVAELQLQDQFDAVNGEGSVEIAGIGKALAKDARPGFNNLLTVIKGLDDAPREKEFPVGVAIEFPSSFVLYNDTNHLIEEVVSNATHLKELHYSLEHFGFFGIGGKFLF